jgi:hypothetical protein
MYEIKKDTLSNLQKLADSLIQFLNQFSDNKIKETMKEKILELVKE